MRGRRVGAQPRGVRGDPSLRAQPQQPPERPPVLSADETVVETERLRLRRFRDDDLDTLHRWHTDERFMRHMGRGLYTREESEAALRRYADHWDEHGFGIVAAEDRSTGALIGRTGVAYHRAWPHDPEVGWAFDPAWWGRGLATEAGGACVAWAFGPLGFGRVVSITVPENAASIRVMAKLGFGLLERVPFPESGLTLWVHSRDARGGRAASRPASRLT